MPYPAEPCTDYIDALHRLLDKRNAEIDRLHSALEWYGNPDHWKAVNHITGGYGPVPAADDMGKRARAALEPDEWKTK